MGREAPKQAMRTEGLVREHKLDPSAMTERVTPTEDLFVLAHFGIPDVRVDDWTLNVEGLVDNPHTFTFDALSRFQKRKVDTVHQCSGSPIDPTKPTRRIANVQWAGADLADILSEAGLQKDATHLWAYGLDQGVFAKEKQDFYLKDIPLERIQEGDVLIAYELNDEPLPIQHGFPARLVVPGYYGTNSVKWLNRLHLADRRPESLFTTRFYNDTVPGSDATTPVWRIAPESIIVSPSPDGTHRIGNIEIWGWAWSDREVRTVEVSIDGGHEWHETILEPRSNRSWQRFSYGWTAQQPGTYELICRATDFDGESQPLDGARNTVHSVAVTVEG